MRINQETGLDVYLDAQRWAKLRKSVYTGEYTRGNRVDQEAEG